MNKIGRKRRRNSLVKKRMAVKKYQSYLLTMTHHSSSNKLSYSLSLSPTNTWQLDIKKIKKEIQK